MGEEEKEIKQYSQDNSGTPPENQDRKKTDKHWIHPKWLRIVLKTFMWFVLSLIFLAILIPILLYIPPVQTFVKDIACNVVEKSTGMKIGIDKFRLKWPADVSLNGVTIIESSGDTMVYAKEVIADVKLAPLFKLDVDINEVKLEEAGLRIMSPDSSMLLKLRANLISIDDKSSIDIRKLIIDLNKVKVEGADLNLNMDIWKKKKYSIRFNSIRFKDSLA